MTTVTKNRCDWCGKEAQEEAGAAYPQGRHPMEGWIVRQGPLNTSGVVGVPPMPGRHFCSEDHERSFVLTRGVALPLG